MAEIIDGTAAKVLTGAPIPRGADAVLPFERTRFTDTAVSISFPVARKSNIVTIGEDVRVGILSTGSEIVGLDTVREVPKGKIRNSNCYTLKAAVRRTGGLTYDLGLVRDDVSLICEKILEGLAHCDMVLVTGGVSVGDYDLTPEAMEQAGVELLVQGVALKPGMACAYGVKDGKLVCGISGNPASALTNFYAIVRPALRKLCGLKKALPPEFPMVLASDFSKKSPVTRLLRGTLDFTDGTVRFFPRKDQGNVVLSSAVGCDAVAVIPAGSGPVPAGTILKGYLI